MWQAFINLIAGTWLIICGFVQTLQTQPVIITAGITIILFGFWGAAAANSRQGSMNGFIGIWLFLSGVVFALAIQWNFLVSGIFIIIVALWDIAGYETPRQINSAQ